MQITINISLTDNATAMLNSADLAIAYLINSEIREILKRFWENWNSRTVVNFATIVVELLSDTQIDTIIILDFRYIQNVVFE